MADLSTLSTDPNLTEAKEEVQTWFSSVVGDATIQNVSMFVLKIALIFVACLIIKRILLASFSKVLSKTKMERGLQTFLRSMINILLWLVIIIVIAITLKIEIAPFVAAFGVIGLALSLAVQDSLSNLAGGINILVSKAFAVGDYIEIGEDGGTVHDIGMIHTSLLTVDHRRIMLPNSKVMSARVINFSAEEKRRVDLEFSASYDAPIEKVQRTLLTMIEERPNVLMEQAPVVRVKSYGESSIDYVLRVWCAQEDYWDLYYDLLEQIKPALDKSGIEMNYPHLNVHIQGDTP